MDLASAIASAGTSGGARMRTGTVTAFNVGTVTVSVAGTGMVGMPYARTYRPLIGDNVVVLADNAVWVCLGSITGSPPNNLVTNPQFDSGTTDWALNVLNSFGGTPTMGTANIEAVFPGQQINGATALTISVPTSPGQSQAYAYSQPIAVSPGEVYAVAADVRGLADASAYNVNTGVYVELGWYPNAVTTTPSSTVTSAVEVTPQGYGWRTLVAANTGVTVPGGVSHLRVHLGMVTQDSSGGHTVTMYYDLAIARKIG